MTKKFYAFNGGGGSSAFRKKIADINDSDILTDAQKVEAIDLILYPPDIIAPVLSSSSQTFMTTIGNDLTLETVTATDEKDGNVTVVQSGTVDFDTEGSYEITYTATDEAGNSASITHTYEVMVVPDNVILYGGESLTYNNEYITWGA